MIYLEVDGSVVSVQRQAPGTRRRYATALRAFGGTHVDQEPEHVKLARMFDERNRVQDVDRYRVGVDGRQYCLMAHREGNLSPQSNRFRDTYIADHGGAGTVAILLESPHRCEYVDGDVGRPVAPAQGKTGDRLHDLLGPLLNAEANASLRNCICGDFRVLLVNPVPFQTSLWWVHRGKLPRWQTLRNAIWKTLWDHGSSEDFLSRLQRYAPDVILNCCTGGKRGIQGEVTRYVREAAAIRLFRGTHPSRWHEGTVFAEASER